MELQTIAGQPSWQINSANTSAFVTQSGGMVGPVTFDLGGKTVSPLSVAPWSEEQKSDVPWKLLEGLRGDFFCLPFGYSPDPYLGEVHPLHGEPANGEWKFDSGTQSKLDLVFECKIRPCKVYKTVRCGDNVVYQRHTVLGLAGPMSYGMHAMVQYKTPGLLGIQKIKYAQVFPGAFEDPAVGGYSSLKPGAEFQELTQVPLANGGFSDLSRFPARAGFDDLVQFAAQSDSDLGWETVTFPEERFVYFQLKDLRVLPSTVLWFSNGGRHYAPWCGTHRGILGIEQVMSNFHLGLRGSVSPNSFQETGVRTYVDVRSDTPLDVRTIFGVAEVPEDFDKVVHVAQSGTGIVLVSESGCRVEKTLDLMFLGLQ